MSTELKRKPCRIETISTSTQLKDGNYNGMVITYPISADKYDAIIYDMYLSIQCSIAQIPRDNTHLIRVIKIYQNDNLIVSNTPLQLQLMGIDVPENSEVMTVRLNHPPLKGGNITVDVEFNNIGRCDVVESKLIISKCYRLEKWMDDYNESKHDQYTIHKSLTDMVHFQCRGYIETLKFKLTNLISKPYDVPPCLESLKVSLITSISGTPSARQELCAFDRNIIQTIVNPLECNKVVMKGLYNNEYRFERDSYYEIPVYADIDDNSKFEIEYRVDKACDLFHIVSSTWKEQE